MDEKVDEDPAAAEIAGEDSDPGITVKLPSGKTIKMISPYEDEGDVPWLVPKDERDFEFYEISWDLLIDDDYRRSKQGNIVVLCRQEISDSWFENLGNGVPHPDKLFKSRYDTFNGKHIIENILGEEIPKAPSPEKPDDLTNASTEKFGGESAHERSVPRKSTNLFKERKIHKKRIKREKLTTLLNKLQQLQILQEDEVPKVEKWFMTKIDREKIIEEEAKRRRRMKKKKSRREIFASLWGEETNFHNEITYDVHYEGEGHGEEEVGGWGEFEEAQQQVGPENQVSVVPNDMEPHETKAEPDSKRTIEDPIAHFDSKEEDEESEAELGGEFEEEESLEDITFSDMEKEEEFLKFIEKRDYREKKETWEYMQRKHKKLFGKLKNKVAVEKSKITREYVKTLNILKVRDNREMLGDWKPFLEFPTPYCIGNENPPEEDPCYRNCFPKHDGECKCTKPECKSRTEGLCANQPDEDGIEARNIDLLVMGVESLLPGGGTRLLRQEMPSPLDCHLGYSMVEENILQQIFLELDDKKPRVPHFCCSGRLNLTPFELKYKYPLWIEELATYYDNLIINDKIRESALARGWINSPYYQFGVGSGLIMAPVDDFDREKIAEFKKRPDYAAKKAEFGKILEDGVLSQEKMQELIMLGIAEQDPFIRDYLEYSQSKREQQEYEYAEIDWNLENNPGIYDGEFPPDILNPEAIDGLEEGEDELSPEDRIRKRKADYLKSRIAVEMSFYRDRNLKRWDDKKFFQESQRRQQKMKEITGETKSKMDDEKIKEMFGHCTFEYAWVHPKNFKELATRHEERKLKKMYPFTDDPKTPTEFQQFLTKWHDQWERVKKIAVQQSIKYRRERHRRVVDEKLAMYERAFKKQLETYEVIGRPPAFLLKALLRKHERKNSYLNFLIRMRKAYLSQQKTDKKNLKKFINCLEKFLEIIDTERRKKREQKMSKIRRMGSFDGEEAEEEEEFFRRREISMKQLVKKQRQKKKSNVELLWNKKYTKEDFESRKFLKGPIRIDKELKGMNEKQVEELYKANKVPLSPEPQAFFLKWFSDDKEDCNKNHYPKMFKVDKKRGSINSVSIMNYMTMLNVAKMVEQDPYDFKFLPNAGQYLKPIYYLPEGMNVPMQMLANYKNEHKDADNGGGGDATEAKVDKQYFSNELMDVWLSRTKAPERIKKLKVQDIVKEEDGHQKKNENQGGDMDEEQESGILIEPEESETEGETTVAQPEKEDDKQWTCPEVEHWANYHYDPYACLRNKPRISRKERTWYRSARERERRAFLKGQKSFMKYIDISKLYCDPEKFKVWKMASTGLLYRGLKKMNPEFVEDEKVHGVGELWNWDTVGGAIDETLGVSSLANFKSLYIPSNDQTNFWDRTADIGDPITKTMPDGYDFSVVHQMKDQGEEKNDPPTSYVVFSSITLPPFLERRSLNKRTTLSKVEDRKLFKVLLSCGTIIFDITRSRHDLYLCCWYLRKLLLKMEKAEQSRQEETVAKKKLVEKVIRNKKESALQPPQNANEPYRPMQRIILITSFVSWARSPNDVKAEINEQSFYKRKPHPDYFDYYTCENLLYRIGRRKPYNIRSTVLFTGLPFGFEEDGLVYVFKMAYEDKREIPIYGPGDNLPPMVHVQDLSKIVISLMKAEKPPLIAFAVHPTDLPLKTRVFNIATQISYSHIRTQPTPHYLWNNILPKTVHDMLQLNFTPESVNNHPLMENPKIRSPFSPKEEGYPLLLELKESRGISPKTVLFLGPPTQMKLDLAKSISVFYNIPLLTRRNIMKEWLKLLQQMQEIEVLSKLFNKAADDAEEQGEKEDEKLKAKEFVLEEMKQVVNDNNNCDVNRKWLLITLQVILRTIRYREIGYVLCDIPLSEKDAEFLFSNKTDMREFTKLLLRKSTDPQPSDLVADAVLMPNTVIYMDSTENDVHEAFQLKKDNDLSDDWRDFWTYKSKLADAQEFFMKRLYKVHRVTSRDEFLLERVVEIIGPPARPGGSLMYQSLFSHMLEEKTGKPEERTQVAHVREFFNMMQQKGLDLAAGITHQCLPTLTDWPKQKLKYSLQPYYVGYRHYPTKKQTLRSAAGPYREVRRKWSKKSRFFNRMPTEGNRMMWRKARKFWAPQDKTKEYIINFEATSI